MMLSRLGLQRLSVREIALELNIKQEQDKYLIAHFHTKCTEIERNFVTVTV